MVSHHRIPSSRECWRMMCLKPLEAIWPSLTPSCTSLGDGSSCNTNDLHKGLLVKNRWCLASNSWMTSTSSSSTCHLYMSNGNLDSFFHFILLTVHMQLLIHFIMFSLFSRTLKVMFPTLVFHIQSTMYRIHTIYNTQSHINSSKCTMKA